MRQILILACVLLAAGAYAARYADQFCGGARDAACGSRAGG